jgi:hypothetical protein
MQHRHRRLRGKATSFAESRVLKTCMRTWSSRLSNIKVGVHLILRSERINNLPATRFRASLANCMQSAWREMSPRSDRLLTSGSWRTRAGCSPVPESRTTCGRRGVIGESRWLRDRLFKVSPGLQGRSSQHDLMSYIPHFDSSRPRLLRQENRQASSDRSAYLEGQSICAQTAHNQGSHSGRAAITATWNVDHSGANEVSEAT